MEVKTEGADSGAEDEIHAFQESGGSQEACMNEGGEGTRQDSSVAPTGTSSSPALEPSSACVGLGHEMSGAPGRTLTAQPTCNRAGAAAHREGGARGGIDVAPPSALRVTAGAAPAAPEAQELTRLGCGRQGAPRLLQARVPAAPSRVWEVLRMERRVPQG